MRLMLRAGLIGLVLVASGLFIAHRLQGFAWAQAGQDLRALSAGQIGLALLAVATAFVAVAGQERAALACLALPVARGRGAGAAMAAAAVSQTAGFGPVVGAIVRRRLLPELTMAQSFAVSACMTVGFFGGIGLLALAAAALVPGMPHQGWAQGALALAVVAVLGWSGLRRPNLLVLGRFLGWLTVDLTALALALWLVLPDAPAFWVLWPVFLVALGVGIASGSPGGVGPFEAAMLALVPGHAEGLVAGFIAFRVLAYLMPALCGAVWALRGAGSEVAAAVPGEMRHMALMGLRALPSEAQLIRQGALTLLCDPEPVLLSGRLNHTRVGLGPVLSGGGAAALAVLERMARVEGRVPMAYKVDARMAAVARTRGYAVVRMAREAVLDPQQFTQGGPDKARLRRKLAHARKAGVVVGAEFLDPIEAEAVVTDWTAVHGRERGFSMGRWQAEYVAGQRVIAARSAAGVLLAFVSFHASEADWTLDLVRFRPGTPDGTTYAMLACALDLARAEGVVRLSLAAVPEPGFGLPGPLGHLIARVMDRRLGLGQFKAAFAPKWQVRYAAAPGPLALAVGGVEVALAVLWPGKLDRRPRLVLLRGGKAAKAAPVDRAA